MADNRDFLHDHAAHCESGVMSLMLRHHGLELSESMVFGLSGALMFAYIPLVKLGGMPLIAYRSMPQAIIRGVRRNLGVGMKMEKFSSPEKGLQALDRLLDRGEIVGAQTSVFWLPYFPEEMRFHFNAHNLIVYGREGDEFLISDPVFEHPMRCPVADLQKARFVKGMMAPKGLLYYPENIPTALDLQKVIPKVIRKNAKTMLKTPVPVAGIRAIRRLAKHLGRLGNKDVHQTKLFLGHIVRMQEEIGTGGAGFRFIYASFLQEAAELLGRKDYDEASAMLTAVGDQWREFALLLVKAIRKKDGVQIDFSALQDKLESVASREAAVYRALLELS
jgi:hypothetical protein